MTNRKATSSNHSPYSALGKYLKQCRIASGKSQSEVAKHLGYSTSQFISNIERGISLPATKSIGHYVQAVSADGNRVVNYMVEYYDTDLRTLVLPKRARRRSALS